MGEFEKWQASWIDLGKGHILKPTHNQAGELVGYLDDHPRADDPSKQCGGAVRLEGYGDGGAEWKVEKAEPLTLSPSLLCRACGDHGWVREGKWVPA